MRTWQIIGRATLILSLASSSYVVDARRSKSELEKRIKTTISRDELKLFASQFWVIAQPIEVRGFGLKATCNYRTTYQIGTARAENRSALISLVSHKNKNHLTFQHDGALSSAYIASDGYLSNFTIRDLSGQTFSSRTLDRDVTLYKQDLTRKGVTQPRLVFDISAVFPELTTTSWRPSEYVAIVYDTDRYEYASYKYVGSGTYQDKGIAILDLEVSKKHPASHQGRIVARMALDYNTMMPILYVAQMKTYFMKMELISCK